MYAWISCTKTYKPLLCFWKSVVREHAYAFLPIFDTHENTLQTSRCLLEFPVPTYCNPLSCSYKGLNSTHVLSALATNRNYTFTNYIFA
jgi:hypothetical protein